VVLGYAALHVVANSAGEEIVIGMLAPPGEAGAHSLRQGAGLAVEHANGTAGPRARVVIRGREGQWGADAVEAARLVTDDGARGLIAPPSGEASHLVLQAAGRTAVPVVTLCADSSVTGAGIPWMVRIARSTSDEAQALFTGLSHHTRRRRWAAVVPAGRAGREIARDLQSAAAASGAHLMEPVEIHPLTPDLSTTGQHVMTQRSDGILLWLDEARAGRLAKALRAAGFTGTLAGPGSLRSPQLIREAGAAAEGFVVATPDFDDAGVAEARRFATTYQARFNAKPDSVATLSYDAASLLVRALRGASPQNSHRAFPLANALAGASGKLRFDRDGNRRVDFELSIFRNGAWERIAVRPTWDCPTRTTTEDR
jgi:ABC-type branched-subunit amino acid transport system substrate-binding protein